MHTDSILSFYTALAKTAGWTIDNQDRISFSDADDKPVPLTIDGKQLLIPTETALRTYDRETQMFFHPLSENIQRGESEVFKLFKRHITVGIIRSMGIIGAALINLQLQPALQRKMNQDQMELMLRLQSATSMKDIVVFQKMVYAPLAEHPDRLDQWPVNFYPKRNGTFDGSVHRRVTVASFPTYQLIKEGGMLTKTSGKEEKDAYRKQDYATYQEVLETVFPDLVIVKANGVTEDYNAPGDASLAPILTSFLRSVGKVVTRMNDVIDVLGDLMDENSRNKAVISMDWEEALKHENRDVLIRLARKVPSLTGNDGEVLSDVSMEEPAKPAAALRTPPPLAAPARSEPVRDQRDDRGYRQDERAAPASIASFVSPLAALAPNQSTPTVAPAPDNRQAIADADRQVRENAARLEAERRDAEHRRRTEVDREAALEKDRREAEQRKSRLASGNVTMRDLLNTRPDTEDRPRGRYDRDDYYDSRDGRRDSRDYRDDRSYRREEPRRAYPGSRDRYRGGDIRDARDYRDERDSRDYRGGRDSRDYRDSRDQRESQYSRSSGGYRDDSYGPRHRY